LVWALPSDTEVLSRVWLCGQFNLSDELFPHSPIVGFRGNMVCSSTRTDSPVARYYHSLERDLEVRVSRLSRRIIVALALA